MLEQVEMRAKEAIELDGYLSPTKTGELAQLYATHKSMQALEHLYGFEGPFASIIPTFTQSIAAQGARKDSHIHIPSFSGNEEIEINKRLLAQERRERQQDVRVLNAVLVQTEAQIQAFRWDNVRTKFEVEGLRMVSSTVTWVAN